MKERHARLTGDTPAAPAAERTLPLGEAMAAFVAAGIGSLALSIIVLLVETHVISVPAVHEGAGTVSGRTPLAAVVWLVSWAILRYRWRERDGGWRKAEAATVAMIVFGLLATFPLVWRLF